MSGECVRSLTGLATDEEWEFSSRPDTLCHCLFAALHNHILPLTVNDSLSISYAEQGSKTIILIVRKILFLEKTKTNKRCQTGQRVFSLGRERWIILVMSVGKFGVKQIELVSFKKKKGGAFSNYSKHTWPQEEPGSTCLSVGKAGKRQPPFWYHQCQTQKQTRHWKIFA